MVENIVKKKKEIVCYKQFLLFSQCFHSYISLLRQNAALRGNGLKSLQTTNMKLMKMSESYKNGQKTLWEKEKLLVTSNFSFSRSVFKKLVLQTRKNQGLFGKRVKRLYQHFTTRSFAKHSALLNINI